MNFLRKELSSYSAASNLSQNNEIRRRKEAGEQLVNLGFGQSPFPIPERAVSALRAQAHNPLYLPADGIEPLRRAVADFHSHFDQLRHFTADSVVCGPGSKELIFLILTVFDGAVFVPSPSWTTYLPQTLLSGRPCVQVPLSREEGWKVTRGALQGALEASGVTGNKLLIINNPDNPTGQAYTDSEQAALSQLLREENFVVISDEIYARLHFGNSHSSLAHHYPERTIITSGISKWASAGGWRLGYALFPQQLAPLRAAVASAGTHTYSCVSSPVQYGACELLGNIAAAEELLPHCRRVLAAVAQLFCCQLQRVGVDVLPAAGGFYLLPDFEILRPHLSKQGITTGAAMCQRILQDTGVALMSAGPAFLRPSEELTVRLCFVDFDGAAALEESRRIGIHCPLPNDFTRLFCQPAHSAAHVLADWVTAVVGQ